MVILLVQYGPIIGGLVVAVIVTFVRRRTKVELPPPVRLSTAIALIVILAAFGAFSVWRVMPPVLPPLGEDVFLMLQLAGYLAPVIAGGVGALLLLVPRPVAGPTGTAALAPRTLTTFAPRSWLIGLVGASAVAVLLAVVAGPASSPDDAGRYVQYEVRVAEHMTVGGSIYGWWFSVPTLIGVALLLGTVLMVIRMISSPALGSDAAADTAVRVVRVRSVLMVGTGALLLHLGEVMRSLSGTSTIRAGLPGGAAGWIELGTSSAALGPVLHWAAVGAVVLGFAMWWSVLFSALPARSRQPGPAVAV